MKCPTCGATNDPANRFCDQCGSRLEPDAGAAQAQAASAPAAAATAAPVCPTCGSVVLPGEAFCDNCGSSLENLMPTVSSFDAPTVFASGPPPMPTASDGSTAAPDATASAAAGPICPACGQQNLPGDQFCDNCGASLTATPAAAPAEAPAVPITNEPVAAPVNEPPPVAPEATPAPDVQPVGPADETVVSSLPIAPAETAPPVAEEPAVAPVAPATPSADTTAEYETKRKQLDDEITRQQQIIAQFEQMQSMFGAAAPAAVTQGLADARDALVRAQADLDALQPPTPAVDPAQVAALNDEIARQQQIITQFEQMQSMFGAAAPAAVTQGLSDARSALAKAEADLQALGLSPAPASTPAATPSTAPASTAPATATPASEPPAIDSTAPTVVAPIAAPPVEVPPAPAAVVNVPRLIVEESGKELPLPAGKQEIIVGREDPISGIHPEIDLTPFGGEGGGVSRQHARINNNNGLWTLTDLNSTNHTKIDGVKLDPNVPVTIKDGSRLQFGRLSLLFRE